MTGPKDTAVVPKDQGIELRCVHCGKWRILEVPRGECLLLSDLLDWPLAHECPPVTVA